MSKPRRTDWSRTRISAWAVGMLNVQKALLMALVTPDLTKMQNENNWSELMVVQEELKTMPFGAIWDEYCRRQGVACDREWIKAVKEYENDVLSRR